MNSLTHIIFKLTKQLEEKAIYLKKILQYLTLTRSQCLMMMSQLALVSEIVQYQGSIAARLITKVI